MLSQVTEMKEQVQKNRTLGLDEALFLPAWAVLLMLGSCGSTPDPQPEPAPELVAEVQPEKIEATSESVNPLPRVAEQVAAQDKSADTTVHELAKPVRKPVVAAPVIAEVEALSEVTQAAAVVTEKVSAKPTAQEQIAQATRASVPGFAKNPEKTEVDVQSNLRELLMRPDWVASNGKKQPGSGEVTAPAEVEKLIELEEDWLEKAASKVESSAVTPGPVATALEVESEESLLLVAISEATPDATTPLGKEVAVTEEVAVDEEVAVAEEVATPSSITAQVSGETFGAEPVDLRVEVVEEVEEQMAEFAVTWPGAEPADLELASVESPPAELEEEHALDSIGEPSEEPLLAAAEGTAELAEEWSLEDDLEALSLEQQPVSFVDMAATLFEPTPEPVFEPVLDPALTPIARSMGFLQDAPARARVLAGPLFALDPSGLLGALVLVAPRATEGTLQIVQAEPRDPNLPAGNRLPQVGTPLDEDTAKLLAEEPGLGWIWWGVEVPTLHVSEDVEIQTPSVGKVRIVLDSGDYVEGILHAVGNSLYWIDGDLGRYSVDSKLVSHVERLPKPGLGIEVEGLQAGDLVRVKLRSGFVEGRLISAKGGKILVESTDGVRMTLDGKDVKRLGDSSTRVVLP